MYHVGPHLIEHADSQYRPLLCLFYRDSLFFCFFGLTNTSHSLFSQNGDRKWTEELGAEEGSSLISADKKPVCMNVDCFSLYVSLTSGLLASLQPPPFPLQPPQTGGRRFNWKKSACGEWKLGCGVINYITVEPFLSGRVATVLNNAMVKGAREHKKEHLLDHIWKTEQYSIGFLLLLVFFALLVIRCTSATELIIKSCWSSGQS